ncbi:ATP-dependent DNA helicase RecG [Gordonibacter massiliensis (ex Traore et al. 2017)]|uniref:Probable DNA 3'-5' helicase RecG n=1 Tax=Gordonibacter massiliensis (ex Traore et al. 2017) TaxID=1841863 RepID=A0A842JFL4_9ACTN|nr:ATP-dependent DNA helicase RecG [Gordonibacter massiliensis (ex Traore et al. 2017)]MBC2890447.1 ATP-dependent DNA helicase RecG [Gordonibacter massiliensis (ex Traore et al. 2017)]
MNSDAPDRLAATLALDESVGRVRLVSPARARALEALGVRTVRDLVTHFPRRYIDLSRRETVASAVIGEQCTIEGSVHEIKLKRPKPKLPLVEITLVDGTGTLMVTAFRQPWLMDQLKAGMRVAVAGKLEFNYGFKRMTNPFIEAIDGGDGQAAGMVIPVHPATEKLSCAWVRRLVGNGLTHVAGLYDPLPLELRAKYRLMSRGAALSAIHFPRSMGEAAEARRRLVYEELLFLELMLMEEGRARAEGREPVRHVTDGPHLAAFAAALPYELTGEQQAARDDILAALAAPSTANHLLLGDVGTGKTVVAAHALAAAADSGGQALLMAPTEVLARQHGQNLGPLFDAAGVTWEVLTGSTPAAEREAVLARVAGGTVDVLIGTHALLEDDVRPARCTLVVIDEQQRFGVDQRAKLLAKGDAPDALYLTATPIPRSLALALFGNLTLSYIKHRPHDTSARSTKVLSKQDRGRAYDAALAALARGEQVYVVCPLVGASAEDRDAKAGKRAGREGDEDEYVYAAISIEDDADLDGDNVAAAEREAAFLQQKTFVDYRVELLHGRLPSAEKQDVMQRFRAGETQVLVATTVIEVGVDVPNATVMIVEDADRFGLSQLHQLRGRVGRGDKPGEVYLVSASKTDAALRRLAAMETTDDGYELAAYDLSLRREGDILGNRQHGASALKLVNVVRDGKVIEAAHADARALLEEDPRLEAPEHRALGREARLAFKRAGEVQGG